MRVTTVADADAACWRAAEVLERLLEAARSERGAAHLALAGGSTPRRAYELLAERVDRWTGIELWFGDERCVAPDDPESNYRMAREALIEPAGIPAEQVHRIPADLGPEPGAAAYARLLRERLPSDDRGRPVLDVALLGLGEDGHTASLFPGRPALDADDKVCVGVHDAPKPPPERVTLTLGVLLAARRCVLLATGAGKADAVAAVMAGPDRSVPASLLRAGRLEVIVDDAAAPAPARER
jgi:6-phosphogluconolactonase